MNNPSDTNSNDPIIQANEVETRPWGKFEVLSKNGTFKTKLITIAPGQRLSLQSHMFRSEWWCVVQGRAAATLDGRMYELEVGKTINIPPCKKHRIHNPGGVDLLLVEVQIGNCDENDIVRFEDDYGRSDV